MQNKIIMIMASGLIFLSGSGCAIPLRLISESPQQKTSLRMRQTFIGEYKLQNEGRALFEAIVIGHNVGDEQILHFLARKIYDLQQNWDKKSLFWDYIYENLHIDGYYDWWVQEKILLPIKSLYEQKLKNVK